jgi:antitoxin component HigA of HigAB toxin-antitoxin module
MTRKRKIIRPLHGDAGYHLALAEIDSCFDREPKVDTTVEMLFDSLATIIEADERERRLAARERRTRKRARYSSFSVVK